VEVAKVADVGRVIFWASLALTPVTLVVHYGFGVEGTVSFVLSGAALAPLAFLIGEATENVSEHTGPGIGGFLNASFGNAPELIIALFAIGSGLPNVVRGSLIGSVVSTSLLVLGAAMVAGGEGRLDRRSLLLQIAMVFAAAAFFLVPSVPGWHGNPERHDLYVLTLPVAAVLLVSYLALTFLNLRRHAASERDEPDEDAWSLKAGLAILACATVATALVSEILVHSLDAFGHALGLSQFFVAAVIVAIVGNAAEQGGAVMIARRGNTRLGAEIAISSSAQIAVFVTPAVALLSFLVGHNLPLAFRPVELAAVCGAALVAALGVADGGSKRWQGFALLALYAGVVTAFWFAGDR
jgi:Ca2+:H+ antiporter